MIFDVFYIINIDAMNNNVLQDMFYYHNKINNVDIHTIGCELSLWDGERIAEMLNNKTESVLLISTCAVTARSQKASEMITERLTKIYPDKKTYITGCGVNYRPEYYKKYGECISNENKFNCKTYNISDGLNNNFIHGHFADNFYDVAYVKVQDGCANNCSYCIVNKLRNNPYSIPYEDIKKQIENHLKYKKTEIELIGTEITFYNSDGMYIDDLCKRILGDYPEITQLSLNALDPASLRIEKLAELMLSNNRMKKLLYLSVQSGSNKILQDMNRHYKRERIIEIYNKFPMIEHNWDLVVGFPGETEEDFNLTCDLVNIVRPTELMMCPFSKREGAPAATMGNQINDDVKTKRIEILRSIICDVEDVEKPYMNKNKEHMTLDLYNDNEVIELYKKLEKNNKKVICDVYFDDKLDTDVFEINNKLLAINFDTMFNIKIVGNSPKYINDFCDYYNGDII